MAYNLMNTLDQEATMLAICPEDEGQDQVWKQ